MSDKHGNPRNDPPPLPEFRKDSSEESFLAELNAALAPLEQSQYRERARDYPIVFVLGLPRSGTTLLNQILASHTDLGYVSNLSACFWSAPVVGIRLAGKLADPEWRSTFVSRFGRTVGPHEPHEFGYFWSRRLKSYRLEEPQEGHEREIDWQSLGEVLRQMAAAYGGAMIFKNVLLNWHAARLHDLMPESCFVLMRRDLLDVAQSLIGLREAVFGSRDHWASAMPTACKGLLDRPYWEQVAGQVFHLNRAIAQQWQKIAPERRIEIDLDALKQQPGEAVGRVASMVSALGHRVQVDVNEMPTFAGRSDARSPEDARKILEALANLERTR